MKMLKTIPALPVQHIARAVTFYKDKMGFGCPYQEKGFAILRRDEIEIHLWASADIGWKLRSIFLFLKPVKTGAETFLAGTASCRIEVLGIDELFEEYKQQNVTYSPKTVITQQPWGHREFPALGLHGNLLTFYEVL